MTPAQEPAPAPLGLRERKKQQIREEIAAVATGMFADRGFDEVTIAQVAEAVGVAKMTVTNHFPLKEDLVFDRRDHVIESLVRAMADREPGESCLARARRYYTEALASGDPTLGHLGVQFARMVEASPALVARERQMHDERELALAAELTTQMKAAPDDLTPRIVAAQIVGVVRVLYYEARRRLLAGESREDLEAHLAEAATDAFGLLRIDLEDYGARR